MARFIEGSDGELNDAKSSAKPDHIVSGRKPLSILMIVALVTLLLTAFGLYGLYGLLKGDEGNFAAQIIYYVWFNLRRLF